MNINYEKRLFNGVISEVTDEQLIPINSSLYKHADAFSGKINEFRQMVEQLKDRVYKQAVELDERIVNWNSKYSAMEFAIEQTESNLSDRMFLRADTDGFYKTIFENFSLTNNVNLNLSTNVDIDTRINSVTLKEIGGSRYLTKDFYRLSASKAPGTFIEPIVVIEGSSLNNLHLDNNSGWTGSVVLRQLKPVTIVLDISLNYETDIGELYLSMVNTSGGASLSAGVTYSDNRFEVVQQDVEVSNTNVLLINRRCKKIQLVITKNSYDERLASGEYRYLFPLRLLKIKKRVDAFESEGSVVSNPYTVFGASKIGIEVCDFTNSNTSIEYFIRIQDNETLTINDIKINPINHPPSSVPYAIKLSDFAKANNITNAAPIVSSKDSISILRISDLGLAQLYSFTNDLKVLNHSVTVSTDNLPSINFFANYKVTSLNSEDLYERTGPYYTSWIYLEKESNRVLNVGTSGIYIEGLPIENSKITITKTGWFKVKIPVESYFDTGTNFSSVENLRERDPLYPYNGKYLIEGTNLNVDPYLGFPKQAKEKLDLVMNLDNLNSKSFYLTRSAIGGTIPALNLYNVILSKDNSAKNAYIEYNQQNYNLMYDCILIAKLKTSSTYESPVLSSYKIKLGD